MTKILFVLVLLVVFILYLTKQKNLLGRLALTEKKYLISLGVKVLDGNIFLSGKVDEPEEKLKITK